MHPEDYFLIVFTLIPTNFMKITKLMAAAALLLSFGVAGCTDDITDEVGQLTRNTDEVSVAYNKDATTRFSIRVPGAWSASVACKNASGASTSAWLKLDPAEGVGNGKDYQWINVIADRNKEGEREAVITISGATRSEAVEIKVTQDAGIFEIGEPSISGSLNEGVESSASLVIDYKKALGSEKVILEAAFEGDNFGLSIGKEEFEVETEGEGSWKLPISGTPDHMGEATIKLKITVDGVLTEKTLTYSINPETLVYKFSFDKFIWGGDIINNKPGITPNPDGSGASKDCVGTEPAEYSCSRGTDGTGDCFATMGAEFRKNRDISDWSGSKVYEHPGYVKISTGSAGGWIMTPPLSGIGGTMDLDVTFKIAYMDATGAKHDNIVFAVEGAGRVDGNPVMMMPSAGSAAEVATNGWTTVTMKVLGATSATRLKWSAVDLTSKISRFMLDDIVVEGAKKLTEPLSPVEVGSITYTATKNSLKFSWEAVKDASAYELTLSKVTTPDFKQTIETAETSYTFEKLESDYYTLAIRSVYSIDAAFNSEPVSVSAATLGVPTEPIDAPVISSVARKAKAVTVKWAEVASATSYAVTFTDATDQVISSTETEALSAELTGLTPETAYSVSVTALFAPNAEMNSPATTQDFTTLPAQLATPVVTLYKQPSYAKAIVTWDPSWKNEEQEDGYIYDVILYEGSNAIREYLEFPFGASPANFLKYAKNGMRFAFAGLKPSTTYTVKVARYPGKSSDQLKSEFGEMNFTTTAEPDYADYLLYEDFDKHPWGGDGLNLAFGFYPKNDGKNLDVETGTCPDGWEYCTPVKNCGNIGKGVGEVAPAGTPSPYHRLFMPAWDSDELKINSEAEGKTFNVYLTNGLMKFGTGSARGHLTLPKFPSLTAPSTVEVKFNASPYCEPNKDTGSLETGLAVCDGVEFYAKILEGPGEIAEADGKSLTATTEVTLTNKTPAQMNADANGCFAYTEHTLKITGATAETRVTIFTKKAAKYYRMWLDDIRVKKL